MSPRRRLFAALLGALTLATLTALPATGADPFPTQRTWSFDQIRAYDAQPAGRNGKGVVVAVLDGWIDRAHPDFSGRALAGADCLGGTCRPGPARPDACQHGTHVAGTVASTSYGVAPAATVLPVRVLAARGKDQDCTGSPDDVAAGIRWAVSQRARIINLSLGTDVPGLDSTASPIRAAVREAANAGALVVFSAGNSGAPVASSYAGDAVVVAATGPDGQLAPYSQRGLGVDLAAPGGSPASVDSCDPATCITSLYPGKRYSVSAGTSMAAPHVSGLAALLFAQAPKRTREQVIDRLRMTTKQIPDAGAGLIDATAALGARPTRKPPPSPAAAPSVEVLRPRSPVQPAAQSVAPAPPAAPVPVPVAVPSAPPQPRRVAATPSLVPVAEQEPPQKPLSRGTLAVAFSLALLAGAGVVAFGRT